MTKLCPECGIGILAQVADDAEDICYCPICDAVIHDCIAREVKEVKEAKHETE